jgi:hypothetical protein
MAIAESRAKLLQSDVAFINYSPGEPKSWNGTLGTYRKYEPFRFPRVEPRNGK